MELLLSATRPNAATCTYSKAPSSSPGLESGGVAMVSLCRCGGEKGSVTLSGKWGHGRFAGGTTTALVVAFSYLPSGPVARSPDDI